MAKGEPRTGVFDIAVGVFLGLTAFSLVALMIYAAYFVI